MKASSAVNILRAFRMRAEMFECSQVGKHEAVALGFAHMITKIPVLLGILDEAGKHDKGLVTFDQEKYIAVRTGYKALELLPPNSEFTVPELKAMMDKVQEKLHSEPPELPGETPNWMKQFGITLEDPEEGEKKN